MNRGISIGKIFGIKINLDYSWFLIFLLLTWNLGAMFGTMHPDWTTVMQWGVGLAASLLFFASVLAHELAHSLVSIANGLSVRRITLFMFGGVSNIQKHPPSPRAEFLITVVGPITSFVIGFILVFVSAFAFPETSGTLTTIQDYQALIQDLGAVPTLLIWLGTINITLGAFNLIPGFPLDGGRILRSILWQITDNLTKATRWASYIGQGVAWTFILGGVAMVFGIQVPFFGSGVANGLWLAFIGWFLNNASRTSYQQILVEDVLEDITVAQVARRDPPVVWETITIEQLVYDHIMVSDDQAFPVIREDNQFVGLVTLDDVRKVDKREWGNRQIASIMTPKAELVSVSPGEDASQALRKLGTHNVRQLPVLEQGNMVGLFRRNDILRWLKLETELKMRK
jgi:Zn-dependent protease/CBS domain-containing protein